MFKPDDPNRPMKRLRRDIARHLAIQVKMMKPNELTKIEFIKELHRRSDESLVDCMFVVEFLEEMLKK